jgi:hypothetical protein
VHPQSPALRALAEKWNAVPAAERANFQSYVTELCEALGVERPRPRGSGYEFEYPVTTTDRKSGKDTTNFIDLYRQGHFILEGKHTDAAELGEERAMGRAYGQAKGYAGDVAHGPPPYLMVMNVARTLLVWDRWSGNYGGVNAARRIDLRTLWQRDDEIEFLRAVWENPESLNPAVRGQVVTREVAEQLAKLSASLEARGLDGERIARFLMRCMFTMFAEDVELLQGKPFQTALRPWKPGTTSHKPFIRNQSQGREKTPRKPFVRTRGTPPPPPPKAPKDRKLPMSLLRPSRSCGVRWTRGSASAFTSCCGSTATSSRMPKFFPSRPRISRSWPRRRRRIGAT